MRLTPGYRLLIVVALAGAIALAGLGLWELTQPGSRPQLTRLNAPVLSTGPCPAHGAAPAVGPALAVTSEWLVGTDPVAVLHRLTRQGWAPSTHMSSSIRLLPIRMAVVPLGLGQVRVYRGIELAYTHERTTHLVSSTSLVLCRT